MEAASISVGDTFYRGTKVEENGKHDDADVDVDDEDGAEVAIGQMHSLHMEVEVEVLERKHPDVELAISNGETGVSDVLTSEWKLERMLVPWCSEQNALVGGSQELALLVFLVHKLWGSQAHVAQERWGLGLL
jgi:hypothetical protein